MFTLLLYQVLYIKIIQKTRRDSEERGGGGGLIVPGPSVAYESELGIRCTFTVRGSLQTCMLNYEGICLTRLFTCMTYIYFLCEWSFVVLRSSQNHQRFRCAAAAPVGKEGRQGGGGGDLTGVGYNHCFSTF